MLDPAFLFASLIVVLIPGTGAVFTISQGLSSGRKAALIAAVGCTLGIVPHLTAAMLGLSALLHAGSAFFRILKYAGTAYLIFLAWQTWRSAGGLAIPDASGSPDGWKIIIRAVLLNLLNPKLTLFFFAFLPQFLAGGSDSNLGEIMGLGFVFMAITAVVFALYGLLAANFRETLSAKPRLVGGIQKGLAVVIAGMAGRLALAAQE